MCCLDAVQLSVEQRVAVWITFQTESGHEFQLADTLVYQLTIARNLHNLHGATYKATLLPCIVNISMTKFEFLHYKKIYAAIVP